jgi:hypothetical protein
MKITRLAVALMLVGAITLGCSDDDPVAVIPGIGVFVCDWEATTAVVVSDAEPDSSLDLTLGGIATVMLSVAADSTYEFTHDVLMLSITGEFLITGANTFDLTNDADPLDVLSGTFTLTSNETVLGVVLPETEIHPDPTSIYNPGTLTASFDKQ